MTHRSMESWTDEPDWEAEAAHLLRGGALMPFAVAVAVRHKRRQVLALHEEARAVEMREVDTIFLAGREGPISPRGHVWRLVAQAKVLQQRYQRLVARGGGGG